MAGFVEYQCSVGQGAGLRRKGCCYISCSCLPTRKIGTHCVDMGSALKNNVVQAGLVVFDVVLYLPSSVSSTRFFKMHVFYRTSCCYCKHKKHFN